MTPTVHLLAGLNGSGKTTWARALIWDLAAQTLRTGTSVVLDWNLWSRERRAEAAERAADLGAPCTLHLLDVPLSTAIERATVRDAPYAHRLDAAAVRHLGRLWEPPVDTEAGFTLHRVDITLA